MLWFVLGLAGLGLFAGVVTADHGVASPMQAFDPPIIVAATLLLSPWQRWPARGRA